jgi:hypothetical protein
VRIIKGEGAAKLTDMQDGAMATVHHVRSDFLVDCLY